MAINAYSKAKESGRVLGKNFTVYEFRCRDGSDPIFIDSELVELLQKIRDHFGKAADIRWPTTASPIWKPTNTKEKGTEP